MAVVYRTVALPETTQPEPRLEWSVFDRRIIHIEGGVAPSTAADAETSTGQSVSVSLRVVPPPLSSYMEIYTDESFFGQPNIIAAHGDLALIYGVFVVKGVRPNDYPGHFFLYKARSPARPWLKHLPSPGDGWRGRVRFTGVLHKGGDDFIVANLQDLVGAEGEEVAEIFRYSSDSREWELLRIDMPGDAESGFYPQSWYSDTVFSHGSFIYWADYHQGLLSADISAMRPHLQFIKFPGIETKVYFEEGRGLPEMLRTAAVSKGRIWFVDVDDGRFRSTWNSMCSPSVNTWSWKATGWVLEHSLDLNKLWSSVGYQHSCLPRTIPEFPVLDLKEDGLVHFIVRESAYSTEHWIATIDMDTSALKAHTKYLNQIETPYLDFDASNMFWDSALLSSQLCKCLDIPAGKEMGGRKNSVEETSGNVEELAKSMRSWAIGGPGQVGEGTDDKAGATTTTTTRWRTGEGCNVVNLPDSGIVRFGSIKWSGGLQQSHKSGIPSLKLHPMLCSHQIDL